MKREQLFKNVLEEMNVSTTGANIFELASKYGLTNATSQSQFRGDAEVTRGEAAAVFLRGTGKPTGTSLNEALNTAMAEGVFLGYGDARGAGTGQEIFESQWYENVAGRSNFLDYGSPSEDFEGEGDGAADVTEEDAVAEAARVQQAMLGKEILTEMLTTYGLESLIDEAWNMLIEMDSPDPTYVALQLRQTDQFKERFIGMDLRRQNGHSAVSPDQYIALERAYKQTMLAAGIPENFYDDVNDLAEFIGNDVAQAEFEQRVSLAARAARSVDPNLKVQLQSMYGVGVENDGELIAYYLDPERGTNIIEQRLQFEAAGLSAAALGTMGSGLTNMTAERLADLDIQRREITERFAGQKNITERLVGEQSAMSTDEFAAATFGLDSEATANLATLRQQREQRGRRTSGSVIGSSGVLGFGSSK